MVKNLETAFFYTVCSEPVGNILVHLSVYNLEAEKSAL